MIRKYSVRHNNLWYDGFVSIEAAHEWAKKQGLVGFYSISSYQVMK